MEKWHVISCPAKITMVLSVTFKTHYSCKSYRLPSPTHQPPLSPICGRAQLVPRLPTPISFTGRGLNVDQIYVMVTGTSLERLCITSFKSLALQPHLYGLYESVFCCL